MDIRDILEVIKGRIKRLKRYYRLVSNEADTGSLNDYKSRIDELENLLEWIKENEK